MSRPRPGARRRAGFAVLLGLAGCAEPGLPPGGPVDDTTPDVLAVTPEPGAVRVPPDAPLVVAFGKKLDGSTVERALWITPADLGKPEIDTDGTTLVIRPGRPLPPDTTMAVLLTTTIRDRKREGRQNPMGEPYRWIFTTGDSLWPGRLHGTVQRVGGPRDGQVLLGLFPAPADTVPDPARTDPMAITQARSDGSFVLDGLPVDGRRWWLVSMLDRDGNREIRGKGEFVSVRADTVRLVPGGRDTSLIVELVDPEAPGEVNGTLVRAPGDSTGVWVELVAGDAVSPSGRERVAPNGEFRMRNVAPGRYRLRAYCDVNRNRARDPEEPVRDLLEITVGPGETVEAGSRDFAPCPAESLQAPAPAPR